LVVAIAGSSGLIGSALVSALRAADHRVLRIVRRAPGNADELYWNPDRGEFDPTGLDGVDAVVNMCGVGVAEKRWSGAVKQALRDSRIDPTDVITDAVIAAGVPVLINASGVGYYGDTGGRIVDETAPAGTGFLARLSADWEAATAPAQDAGVRVVLARARRGATQRARRRRRQLLCLRARPKIPQPYFFRCQYPRRRQCMPGVGSQADQLEGLTGSHAHEDETAQSQEGTEGNDSAFAQRGPPLHHHADDGAAAGRQQNNRNEPGPAEPGTERRKKFEIAVAHAIFSCQQFEHPKNRP
jgi:hypothetical protein